MPQQRLRSRRSGTEPQSAILTWSFRPGWGFRCESNPRLFGYKGRLPQPGIHAISSGAARAALEQRYRSAMISATLLCRLRRGMLRMLALLLAIPLMAPAVATETVIDLQLVLAIDASNSVTDERFELQKQGYVAAFRNPQVIKAIM